jgi:hypothetical protein
MVLREGVTGDEVLATAAARLQVGGASALRR